MCTLTNWRRIPPPPPPPEKFGTAASRILVGAPARQPDLVGASRKTDGGAAEGSSLLCILFILYFSLFLLSLLFIVYFCMYVFFSFDEFHFIYEFSILVNKVVHIRQTRAEINCSEQHKTTIPLELVDKSCHTNEIWILANTYSYFIGLVILTRHRKQALSTHAPQQPRKLNVATTTPITTSTLARWPVMTSGPETGIDCSRSR